MARHFLRELDSAVSFWQKLWMTILLLVFGVLIGPLLWIGSQFVQGRYESILVSFAIDTIAVYYATLIAYVWWRPRFLQRFYAAQERGLVFIGRFLAIVFLGLMLLGGIYGVVKFLNGQ